MKGIKKILVIFFAVVSLFCASVFPFLEFAIPHPRIWIFVLSFGLFLGGIYWFLKVGGFGMNKYWFLGISFYYVGFLFFRWGLSPHAILDKFSHLIVEFTICSIGLVFAWQGQLIEEKKLKQRT